MTLTDEITLPIQFAPANANVFIAIALNCFDTPVFNKIGKGFQVVGGGEVLEISLFSGAALHEGCAHLLSLAALHLRNPLRSQVPIPAS